MFFTRLLSMSSKRVLKVFLKHSESILNVFLSVLEAFSMYFQCILKAVPRYSKCMCTGISMYVGGIYEVFRICGKVSLKYFHVF